MRFIDLFAGVGGFPIWYNIPIWQISTQLTQSPKNQSLWSNTKQDLHKNSLENYTELVKKLSGHGSRNSELKGEFQRTQTKKAATMPLGKVMTQDMQPSTPESGRREVKQTSAKFARRDNTLNGQTLRASSQTFGTISKCANPVTQNTTGKSKTLRVIDLFAGVGGFHLGLKNASDFFDVVYSNEYDKYANSVYRKHFGKCDDRDIRTVAVNEIPDHDLLCAGFPCQAFSVAGKRRGFEDTRGTLFFEIARIARDKRPRYLFLENVKGLLSHDNGKTFQTILGVLADLGYECEWQVLNSKHFGVPQNRERVFIIGHLGGSGGRKVFPVGTEDTSSLKYVTGGGIDKWLDDGKDNSRNHSQGQRVYSAEGISSTLSSQGGGWGAKTGLYAVAVDRGVLKEKEMANTLDANYYKGIDNHQARTGVMHAMRWQRTEKGKKARRKSQSEGRDYTPFSDGHREIVPVEGKPVGALTSQAIAKDSLIGNETRIRRLTPIECERLQGFPDDWTKYGADGEEMSDTQRYKIMGNAVTTNVITAIANKLMANPTESEGGE